MAKNVLSLTNEDKKYLMERLCYTEKDFPRIEYKLSNIELVIIDHNITKGCKKRKCGARRAIEVLGRETFLNGVLWASWCFTARRFNQDERYEIRFNVKKPWE